MAMNTQPHPQLRLDTADRHGRETGCDTRLKRDDVAWRILPSERERLLGAGAPDWFALDTDDRASLVKEGHQRQTWRVCLDDLTVYAKVVCVDGWPDRLKALLVGTTADREWAACRRAEILGVPAVRALAVGARRGRAAATVFVSQEQAGSTSLYEAWRDRVGAGPPYGRLANAKPLIDAAATLFAVSHDRGFLHGDAQAGNILVQQRGPCGWDASFVDLVSADTVAAPASMPSAFKSLVQFDEQFDPQPTSRERLRFLLRYRRLRERIDRGGHHFSNRAWLRALAQVFEVHNRRLVHHRDRRLRRRGKYFTTVSLGAGWRATITLALARRHMFPERHIPDRSVRDWQDLLAPIVVNGFELTNVRQGLAAQGLDVEVHRYESLWARLVATLRGTRHRDKFNHCHRERHRNRPSPLVLAFLHHRTLGLIDTTVVVIDSHAREVNQSSPPLDRATGPVSHS